MDLESIRRGVDPRDKYDPVKWDFNERKGYKTIYIEGYPYKVLNEKGSNKVAQKLHKLRLYTNKLMKKLEKEKYKYPKQSDNIEIFLDIHKEYPCEFHTAPPFRKRIKKHKTNSNYLLSQIPHNSDFDGLNKPRLRCMTYEPEVGPDGSIRADYRDIFLRLTPETKLSDLQSLYIHELAHTGANHNRFRIDDHKIDFQTCENILKNLKIEL